MFKAKVKNKGLVFKILTNLKSFIYTIFKNPSNSLIVVYQTVWVAKLFTTFYRIDTRIFFIFELIFPCYIMCDLFFQWCLILIKFIGHLLHYLQHSQGHRRLLPLVYTKLFQATLHCGVNMTPTFLWK